MISSISQCGKDLDFLPTRDWPAALPAIAWRGQLVCGFTREQGAAFDVSVLQRAGLISTLKACHPELGLAELARLSARLEQTWPDLFVELRAGLHQEYGLRGGERLSETLGALRLTPLVFQQWVDARRVSPRDLAPLLALPKPEEFYPFLEALPPLGFSRSDGTRALELGVELFLLGRPLSDLLPSQNTAARYLQALERWRRPQAAARDEEWRADVERWPWPSQVQGQWKRFGDQSGLEINIRTTSPEDLGRKLERLTSIGSAWSCKS